MSIKEQKSQLRDWMNKKFKNSEHEMLQQEHQTNYLHQKILETECWKKAPGILLYYSMGQELSTIYLMYQALESQKIVALPRIESNNELAFYVWNGDETSLISHPYGMKEPNPEICTKWTPTEEGESWMVITPGLAFDSHCHRLGRGMGYYDRFIQKYRNMNLAFVAPVFSFQMVHQVPVDESDEPVDMIISPQGTFIRS